MKFTFEIKIANSEGALERILGRLRQRSFSICTLLAGCSEDGASMDVRVTVESARPVEPVVKQIRKLYEVEQVKVHRMEADHGYAQFTASPFEFCLPV